MIEPHNTGRLVPAVCALATLAATPLWGTGVLLIGLAVAGAAHPLSVVVARRGESERHPTSTRAPSMRSAGISPASPRTSRTARALSR